MTKQIAVKYALGYMCDNEYSDIYNRYNISIDLIKDPDIRCYYKCMYFNISILEDKQAFLKKIYTKLNTLNTRCFAVGLYKTIISGYTYCIYSYYYIDRKNKQSIDNLVNPYIIMGNTQY